MIKIKHIYLRKAKKFFNQEILNPFILFYRNLAYKQNIELTLGEIALSRELCKHNMNVIDAGARTDIFLAELFQNSNEKKILLIEPNPKFCKILQKKVKKFDFKNTKILQLALGNQEGSLNYYKHSQSLILRNVYGEKHDAKTLNKSVILTTIDKLVQSENINYPIFIKTDLEMYDYYAISGGKNTIESLASVVQFELGLETESGGESRRVIDFIKLFSNKWEFFILHDINNQYLVQINPKRLPLFKLMPNEYKKIENFCSTGLTFNIAAIRSDWKDRLNQLFLEN